MNPRVAVAITAQNQTAPAFGEVVKDANAAASQIEGASNRAGAASVRQSHAMMTLGKSTAAAAAQQKNLVFQLNDVAVSLAGGANPLMVLMQQGGQLATIYGPEEGGLGKVFKETGNLAVGMVTKFWPVAAAVAAGTAAVAGLTYEINKTSDVQVSFFDTALAGWQLFAESIGNLLKPVWEWIADSMRWVWDQTAPVLKQIGNDIAGAFVAAYNVVTSGWENLPTFMGGLGKQAWNALMDGMSGDAVTWTNPFTGEKTKLLSFDFSGFKADLSDAEKGVWQSSVGDAFSQDYMGNAFGALSERSQALALKRLAASAGKTAEVGKSATEELSSGLKAANDNAKSLSDTLAGTLTDGVMSVWQAFRSGGNVLESLSNQLAIFADQLLGNAVQGFFNSIFGVGIGGGIAGIGGGLGKVVGGAVTRGFEGGGYTGAGARSGGLDGRGGFMAMLHPDETVIDHTKGGGAANSNTGGHISVSVSVGVQNGNIVPLIVQVSGEVAGRKIKQEAPAAVAAAQRNGAF